MTQKTKLIIKKDGVLSNEVVLDNSAKVKFVATDNMQISLLNAETAQETPNFKAKKSEKDLVIADENGNEFLIIEDYYLFESIEVGTITDSGFVQFAYADTATGEMVATVSESSYTSLIADMLSSGSVADTATSTISSNALWGGLGALTLGAAAIASSDSNSSSSSPKDTTPPSTLTQNFSTDGKVVTGKTEAGATVTATYEGKVVGSAVADKDGNYSLSLDKAFSNGEIVEVTAADQAGNTTKANVVTAPDTTAPSSLTQSISADGKLVSGKTEAGATVNVSLDGKVIGTAIADADGNYSAQLNNSFAGGEKLQVIATDKAGNATKPNLIIAPDITAPESLTQTLAEDNRTVTGKTEVGATVTATYNGKVVGSAVADKDGNYTLSLDKAFSNGEIISISAADQAGNTTKANVVTAPDTTAPSSLTQSISADGKMITGKTEAGATVSITQDGKVIGKAVADAEGNYSAKISTSFAGGEKLQVIATDKAGNTTKANVVTAPDTTAPESLTQTLAEDNRTVTGKTEAEATVTATYNGKVVGSAVADKDGNYSLSLDKTYSNGEVVEVTAADKAGNATLPGEVYAPIAKLTTDTVNLELSPSFETRIENELQAVVDKQSYNSLNNNISFEVTGQNATLELEVYNSSGIVRASYNISIQGPGVSSSNSGSVQSIGSTVYPIDLELGTLSPGTYNINLVINASGSTISFKVNEYVNIEYQDFVGYQDITGNIFSDGIAPENYELKIDGKSLVYKANNPTVKAITLTTENGELELNADGTYIYSTNRTEGGLGAEQLNDSFDLQIFDLQGNEAGTIGLDIIPDVNYGEQFVYFDGMGLFGSDGNDILVANESSSLLAGGSGNDVYKYIASDDGESFPSYTTIRDIQGSDTIDLSNISSSSVELSRSGDDLIMDLMLVYGGTINVEDHFGSGTIDSISFYDGSAWDRADIDSIVNSGMII